MGDPMPDLTEFEQLEEDFDDLSFSIETKTLALANGRSKTLRKEMRKEIIKSMQDMKDIIASMKKTVPADDIIWDYYEMVYKVHEKDLKKLKDLEKLSKQPRARYPIIYEDTQKEILEKIATKDRERLEVREARQLCQSIYSKTTQALTARHDYLNKKYERCKEKIINKIGNNKAYQKLYEAYKKEEKKQKKAAKKGIQRDKDQPVFLNAYQERTKMSKRLDRLQAKMEKYVQECNKLVEEAEKSFAKPELDKVRWRIGINVNDIKKRLRQTVLEFEGRLANYRELVDPNAKEKIERYLPRFQPLRF